MRATEPIKKFRIIPIISLGCFVLFHSCDANAFDKRLQTGVSVGYSGTYIDEDNFPNIFDGLALGGYMEYGLNKVFAISIDGAVDLHRPYQAWVQGEILDDEGKQDLGWVEGPKVTKYFHTTGAISVLYAIDLFRIVPVFSVGFVATRVDKRIDGKHEKESAFGFRIGGGFEYYLGRFSFGAGVHSDRYIGRDIELINRLCVSAKGAVVFDFGAESLE
jgi:hypothetical protein